MSRFFVGITPAEDRRQGRLVFFVLAGAIVLVPTIYLAISLEQPFVLFALILIVSKLVVNGYSLVKMIVKVQSAEIGTDQIKWNVHDKNMPDVWFLWDDVKWIKRENNGNLVFFLDSSFCHNLRIGDFSEEDRYRLTTLVKEYAERRNLPLVNFSAASLALA